MRNIENMGNTIVVEKLSYKGWQKQFGTLATRNTTYAIIASIGALVGVLTAAFNLNNS
jgi:hypothetical protein